MASFRDSGEVRGMWLEVPIEQVDFVPLAISEGFQIHHAEKDHVMLTYWIPGEKGVPNSLPPYNTHSVGVGALVMAPDGKLLAVQVSEFVVLPASFSSPSIAVPGTVSPKSPENNLGTLGPGIDKKGLLEDANRPCGCWGRRVRCLRARGEGPCLNSPSTSGSQVCRRSALHGICLLHPPSPLLPRALAPPPSTACAHAELFFF